MRRLAAVVVALFALAAPASAEEIKSFDSAIAVREDGAIDVTETITVTVEHDQIERGIFRDFPVEHTEADGSVTGATLDVLQVTRNGAAEPYEIEPRGAYRRIRIGDPDTLLPAPSEQTYEIHYRTKGQLRAFNDRDELYWNVTGNEWAFPIDAASVEINLPKPADFLSHAAYTGPTGATGEDFAVDAVTPTQFRAHTTRRLQPGEGFTVAVGWPTGLVAVPPVQVVRGPPVEAPETVLGLPTPLVTGGGATLIGLLVLFVTWLRTGRDPKGGAIYPRFDPPEGLSAAACRYVWHQGSDDRCLTAAIVGMAVKGALRIVETGEKTFFGRTVYALKPQGPMDKGLGPGERRAYADLFRTGEPLALTADRSNGRIMDLARRALAGALAKEHRGVAFKRNSGLLWLGGLSGPLAALVLVLAINWGDVDAILLQLIPWLFAMAAGFMVVAFVRGVILPLFSARDWPSRIRLLVPLVVVGVFGAFIVNMLAQTGFPPIFEMLGPGITTCAAAGALFGAALPVFGWLMRAPTAAGRTLLDEIEGLRLYLGVAEEDRLNMANPPERTPARFEAMLPYAIALGLTNEWAARFAGVLAGLAAPAWYGGHGAFDADRFARSFASDVSSAVSSTTAPSRSSGSGSSGGGSSGGGGGGGGGGGW